jgi:hypothetical protein
VLWSGVVVALSIAFFNFFGLSVTRHVSATARSLTDTCRTLAIWIVSLALGWEFLVWPISLLQVAGFSLLVYVFLIYYIEDKNALTCEFFFLSLVSFGTYSCSYGTVSPRDFWFCHFSLSHLFFSLTDLVLVQ